MTESEGEAIRRFRRWLVTISIYTACMTLALAIMAVIGLLAMTLTGRI